MEIAAWMLIAAAPAVAPSPLAPLRPLVGGCYSAEVAPGTIDTHCFSPVFGDAHVRDVHHVTVGKKRVYSGETIFSAVGSGVQFVYVNSLGGRGEGRMTPIAGALDFQMMIAATPGAAPARSVARWVLGKDGYTVSQDGKTRHFRRVG